MNAQRASAPVRLARLAAVVVMVALAAAVVIRLAGRRGAPPPAPVEPPPEGRIVDLKERVRHQEYQGGRLVADIRGASFFRGPDGRNHLTGPVEITNFGSAGEILSRLSADEVVYDPGTLRFSVSGHVRVEAAGVALEGDSFDYDKTSGTFGTTAGGAFSSKSMSGQAKEILYTEGADEVRLAGGVRVELAAAGRPGETVVLAGDSFTYKRRERRGSATGRAELAGDGSRGEAHSIAFEAREKENGFRSAAFEGAARIVLAAGAPDGPGRGEVGAERIRVAFDRNGGRIASIEAEGSTELLLRGTEGPTTVVRAATAGLSFGPDGEISKWSASGGIRVELTGPGSLSRTFEGETAAFEASTGMLGVQGGADRPAAADSSEARVEAASMTAEPGAGDLEAKGGVLCVFKPDEGRRSMGIFSSGEAVSVKGDRLVFKDGASAAAFTGDVRAWQGTEFLVAGELEFTEATGEMRGRGGVSVGLTQAAAGGAAGRRIELGGENMVYLSDLRTLTLTTKAYVQLPGARLEAGAVSAVLVRQGNSVESLGATGGVVVSKDRYEGRAGSASYQAATDRITLTGRPILTDEKGGSARGDKLTFDMADDKILIENEGTGRATTVVRS